MIPTRINLKGDIRTASDWIGFAKSSLYRLRLYMAETGITQAKRRIRPQPFVRILYYASYRINFIQIEVPVARGHGIEKELRECPCYPCFALGVITKVYTLTSDEQRDGNKYLYDAIICTSKSYTILEQYALRSANFEQYKVGQKVFITIGASDFDSTEVDCCADEDCLAKDLESITKIDNGVLSTSPMVVSGKMKKWLRKTTGY